MFPLGLKHGGEDDPVSTRSSGSRRRRRAAEMRSRVVMAGGIKRQI
jgi:hypothetical protein